MSIPQYGGVGGVPELDLGQDGSARQASGDAEYIVRVVEGPDVALIVTLRFAQLNFTTEDNLGFDSAQVIWHGTLKMKNATVRRAMINHMNKFRHGSDRTTGSLGAVDLSFIQPTTLIDAFGTAITTRARMSTWKLGDTESLFNSSFGFITSLTVAFKLMG